jgi:ACS family tartrate transporter-like MFS transporter
MIRRLALPLALLTFVNAIDRVNLSFAAEAMGADIGLSPATFGLGVSAFFVAYLIFQYPHAEILRRVGIRRWLLGTMFLWGIAGILMSQVTSVTHLLGARFLLGAAEAGFAPGVTWFINRWLPAETRAKAMATILAAVPLSLVMAGPLCGWMLGSANPLGLPAWRWMFLLQALPNFVLAVAAYFYFHDDVPSSRWLSNHERELLAPASITPPREALGSVIKDVRVWRCAVTWLLVMTGSYALLFWLPQLVRQMGIAANEFQIGVLSILPQAGLVLGMLVNGWHSDRSGERRWHAGIPAAIAGLLLLVGSLLPPGWPALLFMIGAGTGIGAAQSVFWAVPASLGIGGGRISIAAIALISMFGTAGGIIGPMLIGIIREATGSFAYSLGALALLLMLGGLIIAPLFGKPSAP